MKYYKMAIFSFVILFYTHSAFSQLLTPANGQVNTPMYDSVGIKVDPKTDLADSLTAIPDTKATIRLPRYFESFSNGKVSGFLHKGTSSTIVINVYQGVAYTSMTAKLSDSVFAKQNATLLQSFETKQNNGDPAMVYIIRFQTKTAPVIRIMYFTGNYNTTFYLSANIPEVVSKLLRNVILASFQTLEF